MNPPLNKLWGILQLCMPIRTWTSVVIITAFLCIPCTGSWHYLQLLSHYHASLQCLLNRLPSKSDRPRASFILWEFLVVLPCGHALQVRVTLNPLYISTGNTRKHIWSLSVPISFIPFHSASQFQVSLFWTTPILSSSTTRRYIAGLTKVVHEYRHILWLIVVFAHEAILLSHLFYFWQPHYVANRGELSMLRLNNNKFYYCSSEVISDYLHSSNSAESSSFDALG